MKRNLTLRVALMSLGFLAGMATALMAQTLEEQLIQELQREGYRTIHVSHTWLGRIRLVAREAGRKREIVFNPRTGEILRDYTQNLPKGNSQDRSGSQHGGQGDGGGGGNGSGGGSSSGGDNGGGGGSGGGSGGGGDHGGGGGGGSGGDHGGGGSGDSGGGDGGGDGGSSANDG